MCQVQIWFPLSYITVNYVASSPVEQFELTESSSSSLTFSWTPPSVVTAFMPGFNLTCEPLLEGIPPPEALTLGSSTPMATVTGLSPGVPYSCSVTTIGPLGVSEPLTVNHTTSEIGIYIHFIMSPARDDCWIFPGQPLQVPRSCLKLLLVRDKSTSPGLLHK